MIGPNAELDDDGKARTLGQRVRRYLVAGLLVWLPIVVTIFVLKFLVGLVDQTMLLVPAKWRPEAVLGFPIPGLGLVLAVVVLFLTGIALTNLVGRQLVSWWEDLMKRIPVVRSIYSGAKTFTEQYVLAEILSAGRRIIATAPAARHGVEHGQHIDYRPERRAVGILLS